MAGCIRFIGQTGKRYLVERILQDRPGHSLGKVYLASTGHDRYVLKGVPKRDVELLKGMYNDLRSSSYVRVAEDSIPAQTMFAYKYLRDHFLLYAQKDVPMLQTKRILRDSLRGLAAMHEKNIVHTDIKPNNIVIDWEEIDGNSLVRKVQIADIESAMYVPDGSAIMGKQVGNWMWRSPEAHASAEVGKPSDIFSFGIVCIYAITKLVIFSVDDKARDEGIDKLAIVLERQLSYFGDNISFDGLLRHLKDSPWAQVFTVLAKSFGKENPVRPIKLWTMIDPDFKDLVGKMTTVDPMARITADKALKHPWFADVDSDRLDAKAKEKSWSLRTLLRSYRIFPFYGSPLVNSMVRVEGAAEDGDRNESHTQI